MIRVVGIGSPFGDDQAGWRVIELLRGRLAGQVELIALDRPGAALIHWMSGADRLVLIDAIGPMGSPGRVHRLDPDALPDQAGGLSSHALTLADTIRLAETLGCRPGRLEIFGLEIAGTTSATLSDAVARGAERLAETLCDRLQAPDTGPDQPRRGRSAGSGVR